MKRPRRNHSAAFKTKVAVAAIKGDRTLVELSERFKVHRNQIGQWRAELLERAAEVFATAAEKRKAVQTSRTLHAKIGHRPAHRADDRRANRYNYLELGLVLA